MSRHSTNPTWWSWLDIVQRADQLGIPNFQRGAVWDLGNRTALLESIYEKSPCGSFVLWQPKDNLEPRKHGVPLRNFGKENPIWLVDGQQRSRAMLDIFQQMQQVPAAGDWSLVRQQELDGLASLQPCSLLQQQEDEETDIDNPDAEAENRFWAVVLPAMREFEQGSTSFFGAHSESRKVVRSSMFRRLSALPRTYLNPKGQEKPMPPAPYGCIPLAILLSPNGLFQQPEERQQAQNALQGFLDGSSSVCGQLDRLLPWGPFFVTGHCFEHINQGKPIPTSWQHLHDRRDNALLERIRQLTDLFQPRWRTLFQQFADMLNGTNFAVGWLPDSDISVAIDAYVRINRAGIRVRAEERALALLSRAHPDLLSDLAQYYEQRDGGTVTDQRALLAHESDRQLGFAMWMTTTTRYSVLALMGTDALRWLDTSAIDKKSYEYRLDRIGPNESENGRKGWAHDYQDAGELIRESAAKASLALLLIDSLLTEELWLDYRMARPHVWGLKTMLEIFYYLPLQAFTHIQQDKILRQSLAQLLRWNLMAPYFDRASMLQLTVHVHGFGQKTTRDLQSLNHWGEDWREQLAAAMQRYQQALLEIWPNRLSKEHSQHAGSDLNSLALTTFGIWVKRDALNLRHPALAWLYATERRNGATEFCWQAQHKGYTNNPRSGIEQGSQPLTEQPLQRYRDDSTGSLLPEKQHMVPFVFARMLVDDSPTRASSSAANGIGNLTWLSQRQNGFNGLAERWAVLDPHRDADNLKARGLDGKAWDLYQKISNGLLQDTPAEELKESYKAFCEERQQWLIGEMGRWLQE